MAYTWPSPVVVTRILSTAILAYGICVLTLELANEIFWRLALHMQQPPIYLWNCHICIYTFVTILHPIWVLTEVAVFELELILRSYFEINLHVWTSSKNQTCHFSRADPKAVMHVTLKPVGSPGSGASFRLPSGLPTRLRTWDWWHRTHSPKALERKYCPKWLEESFCDFY